MIPHGTDHSFASPKKWPHGTPQNANRPLSNGAGHPNAENQKYHISGGQHSQLDVSNTTLLKGTDNSSH